MSDNLFLFAPVHQSLYRIATDHSYWHPDTRFIPVREGVSLSDRIADATGADRDAVKAVIIQAITETKRPTPEELEEEQRRREEAWFDQTSLETAHEIAGIVTGGGEPSQRNARVQIAVREALRRAAK